MKIACLEGEWSQRLQDRSTVKPLLDLLYEVQGIDYVYFRCNKPGVLSDYLSRLRQATTYRVIYISTHGKQGNLWFYPNETMSLDDLAKIMGEDSFQGRYLHLGGCRIMGAPRQVENLITDTGVRLVSGYTKNMDWVKSASFELSSLHMLAKNDLNPRSWNGWWKDQLCVVDDLGFTAQIQWSDDGEIYVYNSDTMP